MHHAGPGAGLVDRTHQPAGSTRVVAAGDGAAGRTGVRTQLCVGEPGATDTWAVCRRPGLGHRLLPVPVPANRRHLAPARPGHRRRRRIAGAQALGGVLSCGAAATASGHLWRSVVGGPALAGRIWPVRDDSLRHLHHRDLRPVQIHLQRPGRQHAGQCAGPVLPGDADRRIRRSRNGALCPGGGREARAHSGLCAWVR